MVVVPLEKRRSKAASQVSVRIAAITPELAAEWMSANVDNRRVSKSSVSAYVRDMSADAFTLSTDAIGFDVTGRPVPACRQF